MGQLVFQENAGGQTALVGPNPSTSISINIPATNGNMVTTGDSGTVTSTMLASSVYTAPGTIGSGTPNTGAFTTLSATTFTGGWASMPSGTRLLFQQTAAPTGWTKITTENDKALRVVSGTASTGGSVAFTTAFASQAVSGTVGNTTLTVAQMPSHTHSKTTSTAGSFTQRVQIGSNTSTSDAFITDPTGGDGSHNHSFSGTAINLAVQYVDVIIASKD
jgi:hypothetical protein